MKTGLNVFVTFVIVILVFSSGTSASVSSAADSTEFFVAPSGSDTNPGTAERPFATPARAQKAVRERIARPVRKTRSRTTTCMT